MGTQKEELVFSVMEIESILEEDEENVDDKTHFIQANRKTSSRGLT